MPSITSPAELRRAIARLAAHGPITERLEAALWSGNGGGKRWYTNQKQHWLGWLGDYAGPGAYGRQNWDRSALFVYNHICCPPMQLWLGEAAGVRRGRVAEAARAAMKNGLSYSARCGAIRKRIPWEMVEQQLAR